ncbi:virulence RhuM family protein [bacterium]|nr:virulence RhuM family protein [bacterium]
MENEIIIYQPDETIKLDVRFENETVWLSQAQMCELFQRERSVITKHISNIFKEGELNVKSVCANFAHTAADQKTYKVAFYNLDVVISVGYRVKSIQGTRFRQWATKVLKDYLLKGYALNHRIELLENQTKKQFDKQDARITNVEKKIDFFVRTSLPPRQGVFYDGQVFDADVFLTKHILSAKRSLILIDNYVDITTLEMLAKKGKGVSLEIVTSKRGNELAASDIKKFNEQYGGLVIRESAKFHDRFLIIDDKELFLIGASIKDLGRKCFAFTKLDANEISRLKSRI